MASVLSSQCQFDCDEHQSHENHQAWIDYSGSLKKDRPTYFQRRMTRNARGHRSSIAVLAHQPLTSSPLCELQAPSATHRSNRDFSSPQKLRECRFVSAAQRKPSGPRPPPRRSSLLAEYTRMLNRCRARLAEIEENRVVGQFEFSLLPSSPINPEPPQSAENCFPGGKIVPGTRRRDMGLQWCGRRK
jgi:hypothetical protein